MLKLEKDNALSRWQMANKAKKKIPLYENKNDIYVKVPFLYVPLNKIRYIKFRKFENEWAYIEIVDV